MPSERTKAVKAKTKNGAADQAAKKAKPQAARPVAPVVRPRGMGARPH